MNNVVAKELLDYIENTLKDGFPEEEIKRTLVDAGWRREDVIAAFVTVKGAKVPPVVPPVAPPLARPSEPKPVDYASSGAEFPQSLLKERPPGSGAYTPSPAPFFPPKTADVIFEKKPAEPQISSSRVSTEPVLKKSLSDLADGRHKKRKTVTIVSIAAAVILLFGGGTLFAYMQGYWPFVAPQDVADNTPPPPEIVDPLQLFGDVFGAGDYKVMFSGKISYASESASGSVALSAEFSPESSTAYYQKGALALISGKKTGESLVMASGTLYLVNNKAKTYSNINDSKADPLVAGIYQELFKFGSPLDGLMGVRKEENITWAKTGESEWQAKIIKRFFPVAPLDASKPVGVKIALDPQNNLITTLSMRFGDADPWQDIVVAYETSDNMAELLVLPKGYKEARLK